MTKYQIFESEGGYRVAFALWGDNPIISNSPWYETLDEARLARERKNLQDAFQSECEKVGYYPDDCAKISEKYQKLIANAQPVPRDDDPKGEK